MISLHTLLAGITDLLIPVAIIAAVALVVIAFFVGFKKGIRRMGWKGLTWFLSGGLFLVLQGAVAKDNHMMTLVMAVASVIVGMIIYNVATVYFRPRMKWKRLKNFELRNKEHDLEYEADYSEYDSMFAKDYVAISHGMKPGFIERIFGGITSIINLFVVIIGIALAAITLISMSQYHDAIPALADFQTYLAIGTDFAFIGFMTVLGCVGFDRGFFCGLRAVFVAFGNIIALGAAMGGAFLFGDKIAGMIGIDIAKFFSAFGGVADLLAKVVLGGILFIPAVIVIALVNYFLGMAARGVRKAKSTRLVDGLIGTIIMIAFAIVVLVIIIGIAYVLEVQYPSVFFTNTSNYLGATKLGDALLSLWQHFLMPIVGKVAELIPGSII
jgi:hypothetical protein